MTDLAPSDLTLISKIKLELEETRFEAVQAEKYNVQNHEHAF